ncbi:Crp/Fnr family transcriptional regulator [Cohaesibacter celericrescens]|nr:Crp/Fnr family transcriptional regulator [Cohaesibacter celericrescens]
MFHVKGQTVFRQGNVADAMYWLDAGKILLYRFTEAGEKVVVHHAEAGSFFAEPSIFSERYHCDAVCVDDCSVVRISKQHVLDALANNSDFSSSFCMILAKQVQSYRLQLEVMAIKSSEQRVWMALNSGFLKGTIMDFSASIGLTHEVVYRSLAKLVKKNKLIKTQRGTYKIASTH